VEPLFLDSAFVIALVFKADQNHANAQAIWDRAIGQRRSFVTTTFVLDEAVTFLSNRGEHKLAVELGNQLLTSPAIEMLDVGRELIEQGWAYFVRHDDKRYSLTDCISFVVMSQRGLFDALTFDSHFIQAGFQIVQV
jgi:hypothetical protein